MKIIGIVLGMIANQLFGSAVLVGVGATGTGCVS
jgi:hypothetical protein